MWLVESGDFTDTGSHKWEEGHGAKRDDTPSLESELRAALANHRIATSTFCKRKHQPANEKDSRLSSRHGHSVHPTRDCADSVCVSRPRHMVQCKA